MTTVTSVTRLVATVAVTIISPLTMLLVLYYLVTIQMSQPCLCCGLGVLMSSLNMNYSNKKF